MNDERLRIVYLNGVYLPLTEARISPEDRGFLLGDGVFETVRTYNGKIFRFDDHANRLFKGLSEVRISPPFDAVSLRSIIMELIARNGAEDSVARITVTRGVGGGGYLIDDGASSTVYVATRPVPDVASLRREGMALSLSPIMRPLPFLSVVKTTSIGAMALARVIAGEGEALMLDADGFVAEGAASTLFAIAGEKIWTTPRAGVLPGITRLVIEEAISVHEKKMTVDFLLSASAIFISATSSGPIPVRTFEKRDYPPDHPLFLEVIEAYDRNA